MQIEHIPIGDLKPNPDNPRVNESAVDAVARSITAFGFNNPIVTDGDLKIAAGHTRRLAAMSLDMETVPVIRVEGLVGTKFTGFSIADNATAAIAEWEEEVLSKLVAELNDDETFALLDLGFDDARLTEILKAQTDTDKDPDFVPELPITPTTKPGDLWTLGDHRLLCGDATKAGDVAFLMAGKIADCLLTDPPYGIGLDTDWSGIDGSKKSMGVAKKIKGKKYAPVIGDDVDFDPAPLFALWPKWREAFLFGGDYYAERIPKRCEGSWLVWDKRKSSQADGFGSEFELIWSKKKHKRRVLRHEWFGFLRESERGQPRVHPTQKPIVLIEDIISQWCKHQNIADPYVGSGTTIIACEKLKRKCYAMEIDPGYCDVAVHRWEEYTGKNAHLEEV